MVTEKNPCYHLWTVFFATYHSGWMSVFLVSANIFSFCVRNSIYYYYKFIFKGFESLSTLLLQYALFLCVDDQRVFDCEHSMEAAVIFCLRITH